jgi:hypothetical protein
MCGECSIEALNLGIDGNLAEDLLNSDQPALIESARK